jgi:hypothetical protein
MPTEKKLKIKNVTEEQIGPDKEKKLCVWFTNDARGLVLNKTNNRTIRGAFGDDTAGWIGKIIVLFPTTDEFRGRMVPVLRVRIPPPKQVAGNGQGAVAAAPVKQPEPAEIEDDELNDQAEIVV